MNENKEYEIKLLDLLSEILKKSDLLFKKSNITYDGPTIKVLSTSVEMYSSEFRIYFYRDDKFFDIIECHIFRKGKKIAELEEFKKWFDEALFELKKSI
jgi:hypothetical protein